MRVRACMCVCVCLWSGAGPSARPHVDGCFSVFTRMRTTVMLSAAERRKFVSVLQCMLVQSVCARVCLVCLCVRACVSPVISQRRFTEYVLPPLATLPCREGEKGQVLLFRDKKWGHSVLRWKSTTALTFKS